VSTLGSPTIRAEEVIARCQKLASFSEDAGSTRRTFLSPPMHDCHREITKWLIAAGATVTVDPAGNLRAFYAGAQSSAPRLLLGSHLDTVPNAGAYDGVLGVVIAVALVESLENRRLPFAIEVLGFSEEEGVRFGLPFIGSRALVGTLDEELLNRQDANGMSVRDAINNFGLNPSEIPRAALKNDTLAYLEFHIEQGPVLESLGRSLGAVEAIAAQTRMEFVFVGRANHAGTTPMHLRRDALAAAAEWIVAVERTAQNHPGLVATVGQIEAKPGAINVIAAESRVTLDVRHKSSNIRGGAADALVRQAHEIADRRGLSLRQNVLMSQRAILAEKVPAAMIFLRSPGGISHDPAESVEVGDVAKALDCGLHLLDQLASSSELQKRISRA
jgi:allantoate deiminase